MHNRSIYIKRMLLLKTNTRRIKWRMKNKNIKIKCRSKRLSRINVSPEISMIIQIAHSNSNKKFPLRINKIWFVQIQTSQLQRTLKRSLNLFNHQLQFWVLISVRHPKHLADQTINKGVVITRISSKTLYLWSLKILNLIDTATCLKLNSLLRVFLKFKVRLLRRPN